MIYSLKPFTKDDLAWVMQLENAVFADDSFPQSLFEDLLEQSSVLGFIATKDNQNAGYIMLRHTIDEAEILTIAVEEQGQGIGSFLMESALTHLLSMDINEIFLEVRPSNTSAIKLYEKFGGEKIGVRPNYYEDEDAYVYRLKLRSN